MWDLGNLETKKIFWLPEKQGLFFLLVRGKTSDITNPRVVVVMKSSTAEFCPVATFLTYLDFCKNSDIDLKSGFVFCPWDKSKHKISVKPLTSSTINAHLQRYLQSLNLWNGETAHGTRSGVALTLSWLGLDKETVKSHVGWKTDSMFYHYTKENDFLRKQSSAMALANGKVDSQIKGKIDLYKDAMSFVRVVQ